MDPKLIMAIDIVDVLRTLADPLAGAMHRNMLLAAANHIEVLRKKCEGFTQQTPADPAKWDPDSYKVVEDDL